MKAAYIEKFGGPEVLTYGDLPDPVAGPGQIVVDPWPRASTAPIGRCAPATTAARPSFRWSWAAISPAWSARVGDGVNDLKSATKCSASWRPAATGPTARRSPSAPHRGKKPAALSHVDAAAMALTGLTAICAIEDTLQLKSGETILIQGGAGGVAGFAIQLAKHIGARVISTASTANLDYVREPGRRRGHRLQRHDFTKVVRNATRCSTPSAAMSRCAPSPSSSRADARPSSPPGDGAQARPQRRDSRSGRPCRASASTWSRSPTSTERAPSARSTSRCSSWRRRAKRWASARRVTSRASWC